MYFEFHLTTVSILSSVVSVKHGELSESEEDPVSARKISTKAKCVKFFISFCESIFIFIVTGERREPSWTVTMDSACFVSVLVFNFDSIVLDLMRTEMIQSGRPLQSSGLEGRGPVQLLPDSLVANSHLSFLSDSNKDVASPAIHQEAADGTPDIDDPMADAVEPEVYVLLLPCKFCFYILNICNSTCVLYNYNRKQKNHGDEPGLNEPDYNMRINFAAVSADLLPLFAKYVANSNIERCSKHF
jgi:hypothetical protein